MIGRPRTIPDCPAAERRRELDRLRKQRRVEQKAALEGWVEQLINSGTGPAYRRVLMLDILKRNQPCP